MKDHADIHGFNGLRWEDQKKIKDKLTGSGMYCISGQVEFGRGCIDETLKTLCYV